MLKSSESSCVRRGFRMLLIGFCVAVCVFMLLLITGVVQYNPEEVPIVNCPVHAEVKLDEVTGACSVCDYDYLGITFGD